MLHEPEFESPESGENTETPQKSSPVKSAVRGVFYLAILAAFGLAVGIQASPKFAATVGQAVPEPVAAAMASITGDKPEIGCGLSDKDCCCSSMSRASMLAASTSQSDAGGCCSASAAASACCESTGEECSGSCPLSAGDTEDLAISLPSPEEQQEAEASESAEESTPEEESI